eukprot:CAMPEP_0197258982 /NCGR_PEP_ID=MMETSP1429-20130617/83285_1 /TAXON_ID=49237 /ORGANISM="Chaetoceros  sp., Strain UNC1202" /LENGTH=606 /DNA_ID=CAMNT_0042723179 /DNA_START=139 /DNA_END=1959 /DNA_ORIENTATION=-
MKTLLVLLSSAAGLSKSHANWIQSTEVLNPQEEEFYGAALVLTPKFLIVGAPFDNGDFGDKNSGLVHIYRRTDQTTLELDDEIEGESEGDTLGYSVDMSADSKTLVVGAPSDDAGVTKGPGLVKVFRLQDEDEGLWEQVGSDLVGRNEAEKFGQSVKISDDGKVVCIAAGKQGASDRQRVDVYRVTGDDFKRFSFVGEIMVPDYHENLDTFIDHVDVVQNGNLDEYFIAVSSPRYENGIGIVMVFKLDKHHENRNKGKVFGDQYDWMMVGKSIVGKKDHDELGKSISLGMTDNIIHLAVGITSYGYYSAGVENKEKSASNSRVEVYRFDTSRGQENKSQEWELFEAIDQLEDGDGTGEAVAISRDGLRLVVGSPKFQDYTGTVRVFDFLEEDDKFYVVGEEFFAGSNEFDGFGSSLSLSGLDLAISAPYGNYVRLYRYEGDTIYGGVLDGDSGRFGSATVIMAFIMTFFIAISAPYGNYVRLYRYEGDTIYGGVLDGDSGRSGFVTFIMTFLILVVVCAVVFIGFMIGKRMGFHLPTRQHHTRVSTNANEGGGSGITSRFPLGVASWRESNLSARVDGEALHGMPGGRVSTNDEDEDYMVEMKQIT